MDTGCLLCPRRCGVDRGAGEVGFCGAGKLPLVARAAPHLWEEPCLIGQGGSGTVFFGGCNLRCVFCQNHVISGGKVGHELTAEQLCATFLLLQEQGVSNINLVTPTPWVPQIKAALDRAWERGLYLPVVYNTGGYELPETVDSLRGYVGVYLPDFKYMDTALAARYSAAPDYPEVAKRALAAMMEQRGTAVYDGEGRMTKGVIVRHLILPGHTEDSMRVLDYLHSAYGDDLVISIMNQYTPMAEMTGNLARRVSDKEYQAVVAFARRIGITNAYLQEGDAASESFIPSFNGEGVVTDTE